MNPQPQPAATQLRAAADAALARGDPRGALASLAQAEALGPPDADLLMVKALALRVAGDPAGAVRTLDQALALDPYNFMALLSKGFLLEKLAGSKAAAAVYKNALTVAPSPLPPSLAAPVGRARTVVTENARALRTELDAKLKSALTQAGPKERERFGEALDIYTGERRPQVQQPILFHYPELPPISFYDRDLFPWLPKLEAATPIITAELQAALAQAAGDFTPYIAYPAGAPVNQWGELNHSRRWSSFFLWRDGVRQEEACKLCPRTAEILDGLPLARQPGYAPTAMFSALEPRTHIPAHTGSTNTRLLVHLPLIVPGPCRFCVGNRTQEWKLGEAWVFDDTMDHEAWNDTDALRVILIFDIWNPYLSDTERELVTAMMAAKAAYDRA